MPRRRLPPERQERRGCSGVIYCGSEVWENPSNNIRLFGKIRRDSPEWKDHYRKRQAIERVFKSLKESRRLERHCIRGLRRVTLHSLMSSSSFSGHGTGADSDGRGGAYALDGPAGGVIGWANRQHIQKRIRTMKIGREFVDTIKCRRSLGESGL